MPEQVEIVYESGLLRPLGPLPAEPRQYQRFTVIIGGADGPSGWPADAYPAVSLDSVRQALAKVSGALAQAVVAEREER